MRFRIPNLEQKIKQATLRAERADREWKKARKKHNQVVSARRRYALLSIEVNAKYRSARQERRIANERLRLLKTLKRNRL